MCTFVVRPHSPVDNSNTSCAIMIRDIELTLGGDTQSRVLELIQGQFKDEIKMTAGWIRGT